MRKIFRVSIALVAIGVLCMSLTGCDKTVQEQKKQIESLNETITGLNAQIEQLNQDLNDTTVTESKMTTSLQKVDGKTVPEFVFVNDAIVFPNKFEIPEAKVDAAVTKISVGSKYSISPTNNWSIRMDGSEVNLNHTSKIWGTMKSLTVDDVTPYKDESVLKGLLQNFFVGFPATNITYTKIYIDERFTGMLAYAPITVENKNYGVLVGCNLRSPYSMSFLFTFEDDGSGVQKELVINLLKTVRYGDSAFAFE